MTLSSLVFTYMTCMACMTFCRNIILYYMLKSDGRYFISRIVLYILLGFLSVFWGFKVSKYDFG